MRHTKIVATIGPASDSEEVIDQVIAAGADVLRLNFSHGTHDSHATTFRRIREAAARASRQVAILQDLSGPKIRTGPSTGGSRGIEVKPQDALTIAAGDFPSEPGRISTSYTELIRAARPGDRLLIDDGHVELRVVDALPTELRTVVVDGGTIGSHKGINAPGVPLPASAMTAKDVEDVRFGIELGVDLVALSFVQTGADLQRAREVMTAAGGADLPLVAKLERPEALAHLSEIVAACDAVMVARGDLGLEIPLERVPRAQKEITRHARAHGIPVIVATQVLESMRTEPRPTRAEVSDAANAVDDGVDAIMLSGETAVGAFPARSIHTLDAIIRDAEAIPLAGVAAPPLETTHDPATQALCGAAVTLAARAGAHAIVAVTRAGTTARILAAMRPQAPILAATNRDAVARRLALYWGVVPFVTSFADGAGQVGMAIVEELRARALVPAGATVVLVSVNPDLTLDNANFLKLQKIGAA